MAMGKSNDSAVSTSRLIRRTVRSAVLALAMLASSFSSLSWSAEFRDAAAPNYFSEPPGVNLETATAIVRSKTGGRVLSANPTSRGSVRGYRVRVLIDDRVVETWFVDKRGRAAHD